MDYEEFSNFLNERMRMKNIGIKRLSELTGVSVKHLEAVLSGIPDRLPPVPYLKGYLSRLGEVLDFDPDEAWEEMKKMAAPKSSGKADEPPRNRFSKEPAGRYIAAALVAFAVLLYLGSRFYEILGAPEISVSNPGENMIAVGTDSFTLSGRISNSSELRINGEFVQAGENGEWQKAVSLRPGINTLEITAKKFLGRETRIIRQIIYQQPAQPEPAPGEPAQDGSF